MTKQEEIREGFKDFICSLAKCDKADACESCEKLELKPVCSIRHNADEYLAYLHSQNVVIKVDRELPKPPEEPRLKIGDDTGWGRFIAGSPEEVWKMTQEAMAGYVAVKPLIKEVLK